jgi:hypothetical protein
MWCCFAAPKNGDRFLGGSIVGLVAHVKQIDLREAAKFLMEPEAQPETKKNPFEGLDGVKDKLDHAHEKVKALGFPELVARALGIGYCSKGLMQGKVCIPLRNEHGLLTGYIGITETMRQLTGEAGARQVPGARVGLVSGFGMINFDRGLASCAALLGSQD